MANPNPVITQEFKQHMFPAKFPDDPLAPKAVAIRFKGSVDKKLRAIPEYSSLIRVAVDEYFARLDREREPVLNRYRGKSMSPHSVRLPKSLGDRLNQLPDKSAWIRRVIAEAVEREL